MQSIQLATLDVEELRTRLRKMSDEELRKFGAAACGDINGRVREFMISSLACSLDTCSPDICTGYGVSSQRA
jgi:hypothetical protein